MKHAPKPGLSAAIVATCLLFSPAAQAVITITLVNSLEVEIFNGLEADFFSLDTANGGTAFFFGNQNPDNLNTADRVPLSALEEQQYFQASTVIPQILGSPLGSTRAYFFDSIPRGGGTAGVNYSVYDINQDGTPDTVFQLDFGPSIADSSDDIILAYGYDSSPSGIDVASARAALMIPEPSSTLLLGFGAMLLASKRRRT